MSLVHNELGMLKHVTLLPKTESDGSEREALISVSPAGFHLRPPLPPHHMTNIITPEADLFQTIHMGPANVDKSRWHLVIDGLVDRPLSVSWSQLLTLPKKSITAFHECYGSPLKPPDTNLWRIGNVTWSGVPLHLLLALAKPKPTARYVWSDGLEHGSFFEAKNTRYQKDVLLTKALTPGCLVAYEMNGAPLVKERGGPVRLIIPGWYGTNSTKWLCRLSLQESRSTSPFTTTYYNEIDPTDDQKKRKRPCWEVEPNSFLLTTPATEGSIAGPSVSITGRAWGALEIDKVGIYTRMTSDQDWKEEAVISLQPREQFEWQHFEADIELSPGTYQVMARANDTAGQTQPLAGRRNHVHCVEIEVV